MDVETLVFVFILVESVQMAGILWNTRQTNKLIRGLMEDPSIGGSVLSNGLHGFIQELAKSKEKQEAFFGLVQIMGQAALEGVRGSTAVKPVKLKGWAKIFEPLVNSPEVQGMIAEKLGETLKKTGEAGVEQATKGWG